ARVRLSVRCWRAAPPPGPISTRCGRSASVRPNVHIGDRSGARHRHTAVFDPVTGTLTALRPGAVTLAVTVNGTTQNVRIRIAAAGSASAA
ncbi:hypothetical protein, partial [Streptomyces sp. NPDC088135]|uniref:hypothetical protein n=1 Tax=Streptomyces sp. NPDC088135 TaxID=3160993 RepID=UPI0034273B5C